LELRVAEADGGASTVRYPRLRFVDTSAAAAFSGMLGAPGARERTPALAHFRVI
jgi:hypothetical protein